MPHQVTEMLPAEDHLSELRAFISGASRAAGKFNPLELARTALSLLQTFPATRNAVLEYFCSLFDSSVAKYIKQIEADAEDVNGTSSTNNNQEEATIAEIHSVLCNFVKANPEAWAPIISTWSLELLGELSGRYAGRAGITATSTLNDSLQLWMSCLATRTLVDITTQCLGCHRDSQACINALLNTSVSHSPHFDWAVAHVGSCFPRTVVTRVLRCGLDVFARHGTETQPAHDKLCSVVAILGHLAAGHLDEIRQAVAELFQMSVEVNDDAVNLLEREATVPFLLQLASLSPTLLSAITSEVLDSLDGVLLERMRLTAPLWCRYFGGTRVALLSLVVSLAMGCHRGGPQIIHLLLKSASADDQDVHPDIQSTAREILEMLLQELSQTLCSTTSVSIPLLVSVKREMSAIQPLLLSTDPLRLYTAIRLVGLVGYHSPADAVTSARYLLLNAGSADHLAALVRLCAPLSTEQLAQAVQQAVRCRDDDSTRLWENLHTLLRWESAGSTTAALSFSSALRSNLHEVCHLLAGTERPALAHWVARVVDLAATRTALQRASVELSLRLTSATVKYFFLCVAQPAGLERTRGLNVCYRILERVSSQTVSARSLAVGELTRLALFGEEARHFGAAPAPQPGAVPAPTQEQRLMEEIHKLGTGSMLTHRMSSTFLVGSLDHRRHVSQQASQSPEDITENAQLLINAIKSCATDLIENDEAVTRVISLEALTMLSLTLVQLVSSDRMYNGLPWPEEEFCKVTVERDLGIRRIMDSTPLAWHLLTLVATHPPCLCYCSVLLRALTATLLAQWAAQHDTPALRRTTQRLVEVMALGQLLPAPLNAIREVVPHVKPVEIMHLLRACVWNYMRDNVPSPAMFSRDAATGVTWRTDPTPPARHHTDTLRFIMQANIATLGPLYAQLFVANATE